MAAKLKGQSLRRLEDARFLTGRGRFIEDLDEPGQAWMHVVRSPHAHAAITHIDLEAARTASGVLGAFTAADLAELGPLPCNVPVASLQPMIVPPRCALATGRARHVGDPVAFVVAETPLAARDAAEAVVVEIDALPARYPVTMRNSTRSRRTKWWNSAPAIWAHRSAMMAKPIRLWTAST